VCHAGKGNELPEPFAVAPGKYSTKRANETVVELAPHEPQQKVNVIGAHGNAVRLQPEVRGCLVNLGVDRAPVRVENVLGGFQHEMDWAVLLERAFAFTLFAHEGTAVK
jgi:hypothetical protein